MKTRNDAFEELAYAVRRALPVMVSAWAGPLREWVNGVVEAGLDLEMDDEAWLEWLGEHSGRLAGLLGEFDHGVFEELHRGAGGAGWVNGVMGRSLFPRERFGARLVDCGLVPYWRSLDFWAARGRGKRCGNSWIAPEKECKVVATAVREWKPDAAVGKMGVMEATKMLKHGVAVSNPYGEEIRFDERLLEHWDSKTLGEKFKRLAHLGEALETVKRPHEIWEDGQHTTYLRRFGENRGMLVWVTPLGASHVQTYQDKHFRELQKRQTGHLYYKRPAAKK